MLRSQLWRHLPGGRALLPTIICLAAVAAPGIPAMSGSATTSTTQLQTATGSNSSSAQAPSITLVSPASTAAGTAVDVSGTTGSCASLVLDTSTKATLTFHGTSEVSVEVAGDPDFVAPITIPPGTYPGVYKLALTNGCGQGGAELTVVNQAPVAGDDQARTTVNTPVDIPVTANDDDPDGDDGYQSSLAELSPPAHGTVALGADSVVYTPADGFAGQDQVRYSLCEVVAADGRTECGNATITVTVEPTATDPGSAAPVATSPGAPPAGGGVPAATSPSTSPPGGAGPVVTTILPGLVPAAERRPPGFDLLPVLVLLLAALVATAARGARARRKARHEGTRQQLRARQRPGTARLTVDADARARPAYTVRLEPRRDAGTQVLRKEVT